MSQLVSSVDLNQMPAIVVGLDGSKIGQTFDVLHARSRTTGGKLVRASIVPPRDPHCGLAGLAVTHMPPFLWAPICIPVPAVPFLIQFLLTYQKAAQNLS